jgi:hypothetical protein
MKLPKNWQQSWLTKRMTLQPINNYHPVWWHSIILTEYGLNELHVFSNILCRGIS